MKTNKVTKEEFKKIFDKAMTVSTAWNGCDEHLEVIPKLVIRDFEITTYPICDSEYTDFETAYDAFKKIGNYSRIMDAAGQIYADYYD